MRPVGTLIYGFEYTNLRKTIEGESGENLNMLFENLGFGNVEMLAVFEKDGCRSIGNYVGGQTQLALIIVLKKQKTYMVESQ